MVNDEVNEMIPGLAINGYRVKVLDRNIFAAALQVRARGIERDYPQRHS